MAKLNLHKDIDKPLWKEHYRGETAPYFYSLSTKSTKASQESHSLHLPSKKTINK